MIKNFDQSIIIKINGENIIVNTLTEGINKIRKLTNNKYSKDFIVYQLNSGEYDVDIWMDTYKSFINNRDFEKLYKEGKITEKEYLRHLKTVKDWNKPSLDKMKYISNIQLPSKSERKLKSMYIFEDFYARKQI